MAVLAGMTVPCLTVYSGCSIVEPVGGIFPSVMDPGKQYMTGFATDRSPV